MKFNIFNVLGWFNKKKCESEVVESPTCNCESWEDVNKHTALSIDATEALEKYLKSINVEFTKADPEYNYMGTEISRRAYNVVVDNIKTTITTCKYDFFSKYAFLSCKACLGWWHFNSPSSNEIKIESPDKYFDEIIKAKIVTEQNRINKNKLAKEICGEI